MIKHNLFPTLVTEFEYPGQPDFRQAFFEQFPSHCDENGHSNETTAHVDLHKDPMFSSFYDFVGKCVKKHVATCGLDPEFQQMYIVKSWMMITREWSVPTHSHADAHLSFVYYVNIPPDFVPDNICLLSSRPNEYYHNMFSMNATEWNEYNAYNFAIPPKEGKLLIFPATLKHFTGTGNESSYINKTEITSSIAGATKMRISVAGDIMFTYKKVVGKSYGLMPLDNWKPID